MSNDDACAEEPLAQRRAADIFDVGDHFVVEQRADLDEMTVGVDDRVVDHLPYPSGARARGRHRACPSRTGPSSPGDPSDQTDRSMLRHVAITRCDRSLNVCAMYSGLVTTSA